MKFDTDGLNSENSLVLYTLRAAPSLALKSLNFKFFSFVSDMIDLVTLGELTLSLLLAAMS